MNVAHLRYAIEVSKTGSVSKAAENLFIGQPSLSKAIKELEEDFGFTIFNRTARGVIPTEKGTEFLNDAKRIVAEIDELEELYRAPDRKGQTFRIAVPRCSFAAEAFSNFAGKLDAEMSVDICFDEMGAMDAISKLLAENYDLAVIRIKDKHEPSFARIISEKELKSELLFGFKYRLLMSKDNGLANKSAVSREDLTGFTRLLWSGDCVRWLAATEMENHHGKQILISDRGSGCELLSAIPDSFMWESPMEAETLDRYGLVQREVADADEGRYLLVYPKFRKPTKLGQMYLEEFNKYVEAFGK